jgi:hypothetical protein
MRLARRAHAVSKHPLLRPQRTEFCSGYQRAAAAGPAAPPAPACASALVTRARNAALAAPAARLAAPRLARRAARWPRHRLRPPAEPRARCALHMCYSAAPAAARAQPSSAAPRALRHCRCPSGPPAPGTRHPQRRGVLRGGYQAAAAGGPTSPSAHACASALVTESRDVPLPAPPRTSSRRARRAAPPAAPSTPRAPPPRPAHAALCTLSAPLRLLQRARCPGALPRAPCSAAAAKAPRQRLARAAPRNCPFREAVTKPPRLGGLLGRLDTPAPVRW